VSLADELLLFSKKRKTKKKNTNKISFPSKTAARTPFFAHVLTIVLPPRARHRRLSTTASAVNESSPLVGSDEKNNN
jgi:hypothetical protein